MKNILSICVIAALAGAAAGYAAPITIPADYTKLSSVAILAGLESVFSAVKLIIRDKFNEKTFALNFFANVFAVVLFVFAGDSLGLDLYYVVLLAVGFRFLQDLDAVRIHLFGR